jgi:hypothetical protein
MWTGQSNRRVREEVTAAGDGDRMLSDSLIIAGALAVVLAVMHLGNHPCDALGRFALPYPAGLVDDVKAALVTCRRKNVNSQALKNIVRITMMGWCRICLDGMCLHRRIDGAKRHLAVGLL